MAQAMIKAVLSDGADYAIAFSQRNESHGRAFAEEWGLTFMPDNAALYETSDAVVLAVKPQQLEAVAADLRSSQANPLVLSILAGTPLARLAELVGHDRLIRVMPNVAASVGASMSIMAPNPGLDDGDIKWAEGFLATIGRTVILDEASLDKAGTVNGCGPAFFFQILEACSDALVALGIPRAVSYEIAAQTMKGSAELALQDGAHPACLKDKVTSPGGTTIAGICAMEKAGVRSGLIDAVMASYAQTLKISQ